MIMFKEKTKLKRCPFCGGKAKFETEGRYYAVYVSVKCSKCNAQTVALHASINYSAREEVVKLWNERISDTNITSDDVNIDNAEAEIERVAINKQYPFRSDSDD